MPSLNGEQAAGREQLVGKAALIASVGGARGYADWTNPDHRLRRLLAWWVYLIGPVAGAVIAVGVVYVLRGPARVSEASVAQGTPLDRAA